VRARRDSIAAEDRRDSTGRVLRDHCLQAACGGPTDARSRAAVTLAPGVTPPNVRSVWWWGNETQVFWAAGNACRQPQLIRFSIREVRQGASTGPVTTGDDFAYWVESRPARAGGPKSIP
jgi:hypothetical protein